MQLILAVLFYSASLVATKQNDGCNCTDAKVDPVCGSNGMTFPNECFFNCTKDIIKDLTISYRSNCAVIKGDICSCKRHNSPVCGSNTVNYNNECELFCDSRVNPSIKVETNSSVCHDDACKCSHIIAPVCGTNNRSYANPCVLDCEAVTRIPGLAVKHIGYCPIINEAEDTCECPNDPNPICGSNSVTYKNMCEFQCQLRTLPNLYVLNNGTCSEDVCHCDGTQDFHPVCADTGETFISYCHFNCALNTQNSSMRMLYRSACPEIINTTESCNCEYDNNPVCGSDSITYINECEFSCKKRINPSLIIVDLKACSNDACGQHSNVLDIQCGSDGVAYPNGDYLFCEKKSNKPDLVKISSGFCPEIDKVKGTCKCYQFDDSGEVCASNGVTYENECLFKCAQLKDPSLIIMKEGACSSYDDPCNLQGENLKPVCGTDGKSYFSPNNLRCESYRKQTGVQVAYNSYCAIKDNDGGLCECQRDDSPVCGSNYVTYNNDCELNCQTKWDKNLMNIKTDTCKSNHMADLCDCDDQFEPVCGTDGNMYFNRCFINCEWRTNNKTDLTILHDGIC